MQLWLLGKVGWQQLYALSKRLGNCSLNFALLYLKIFNLSTVSTSTAKNRQPLVGNFTLSSGHKKAKVSTVSSDRELHG
jgi:hypothetical protein